MAYPCVFIDDGETRLAYLEPMERQYGAIRFTYRPATVLERSRFNKQYNQMVSADEQEAATSQWMAEHIVEWQLRDKGGKVAPVEPKWILKLHPEAYNLIYAVLLGSISGSIDPQWNGDEVNTYAQRQLDQSTSAAKNSPEEVSAGN